jgi:hypothetical protein
VASSHGYNPLAKSPSLRLKLHLYQLAKHLPTKGIQEPGDSTEANDPDFNEILALASGLTNESRQILIHQIKQMISRDSIN